MAYAKKAGSVDDKFKAISDKVIKLLEAGVKPWARPWISPKGGTFKNIFSENGYSGSNPMICAIDVMVNNYSSPLFVGFNQAKEKGWQVRKGSKATSIIWGGSYVVEDEDGKELRRSAFKWLPVFNIDCVDDSASDVKISDFLPDQGAVLPPVPVIEDLEKIIKASGATIKYGGSEAFYCPSLDSIQMPDRSSFLDSIGFYSVAIHELSHWTGHKDRLSRDKSCYAFEELVAEMGSAMVLSDKGFEQRLDQHASYINGWLSKIKSDPKAIFRAMGLAAKAANYLLDKAA
jgi:antirestriction protein ArdC